MGFDVMDRFERCLVAAAATEPDAYFLTGDFCAHDPEAVIYEWLRPRLDALGTPYCLAAGNHDDRQLMRTAFSLPGVGNDPIRYVATVGTRRFLFLDSCPGTVDDGQIDWLAGQLADDPEAAVVVHHPPCPMGVVFMDAKYPLQENEKLLSTLQAHGPRHVFCGHYHSGCDLTLPGGLQVHLCPPTSFFIDPRAEDFQLERLPPAWRQIDWSDDGTMRIANRYLA